MKYVKNQLDKAWMVRLRCHKLMKGHYLWPSIQDPKPSRNQSGTPWNQPGLVQGWFRVITGGPKTVASSGLRYVNRSMTTCTKVICLKKFTGDAAGAGKLNIGIRDQKLKSGSRTSLPMPEI